MEDKNTKFNREYILARIVWMVALVLGIFVVIAVTKYLGVRSFEYLVVYIIVALIIVSYFEAKYWEKEEETQISHTIPVDT